MTDFQIIYEKTDTGFSAYAPALPGLGVAGETIEETEQLMRDAIAFHLQALRASGATSSTAMGITLSCASTTVPLVVGGQSVTVLAPEWQPTTDTTVQQLQNA